MAAPIEVYSESISADGQSSNQTIARSNSYDLVWIWEFTMTGSGSNQLKITPQIPLNYETPGDTQVYQSLSSTEFGRWPYWITDEMITAEGGTWTRSYRMPNSYDKMRFDYDYEGGGSRVFAISLRIAY